MMNEEGEVYLVDFGSAVLGYERQGFDCTGTIGYAAPEQYQGRVSSSSDIYALGKTLERLCGKKKIRYYILYQDLAFLSENAAAVGRTKDGGQQKRRRKPSPEYILFP